MGNDSSKTNVSKTQSTTITHTAPPTSPKVLWGASGDKDKDRSSSPRGSTSDKKKSGSTKDRSESKNESDDKSRRRDHSSERHKSRDRDKDKDRDRDKDRERRHKERSKSKDKSRSHSRDKHKHKHHTHEPVPQPIYVPPPPPTPPPQQVIQPAMAVAVDHPPDYRHRASWNDMGHYPPPVAHAYADILETIRQERMHLEMLRSQFDEWRFAHQVQLAHQMMDVSYHRRLLDDYKAELDRYQYDAQSGHGNTHPQGWDNVMNQRAELDRYYQQLNMYDSNRGPPMSPTQSSPYSQYGGGYGSPPFSPRPMY